ncbi:aminodeoxychorismate synthase component I [Bacillus sp. B15-48]|nr:aminodeoxychorismate synthase component I [Bacillus sp. B15-48]MBM4762841.1 aminodeoxychorismate synthase component I [Bacillus sp. B15-48]
MQTKTTPVLSFEFANLQGKIKPFTFKKPIKIITTDLIENVIPCLRHIQNEVDKGFYAAGFLSYESAPAFDSAYRVHFGNTMPLLWFGIFSEPLHETMNSTGNYSLKEWLPSVSKEEYYSSIQSIKQLIENGETYQTNYTIRLLSNFHGDELAFFEALKKAQSSNYCAYIHTGEHSILSASPELFFHLKGNQLTTRPMKGTMKRGNTCSEDEANAKWLLNSEKNRAENLMIVDLLRNDLGMIAEPGSVSVPKLFDIEKYPTVHQMTSTITAKVSPQTELVDIFKALFPCGSITGAPKISTMNTIADLETTPREIYCGAIGFISPNKEAVFNVPIRTVLIDHQTSVATYGVGGGVTWDSTAEGEYDEIITKAKLLKEQRLEFKLLESLLLEKGEYFLKEYHLERLSKSANYFDFTFNREAVEKSLYMFTKQQQNQQKMKVRLLMGKNGEITIEGQQIEEIKTPITAILASKAVNKNNPFLYHKTTNRQIYSAFHDRKPNQAFDVLLWNEELEITEFTNGNVVFELDNQLFTPPVQSGLLAGTFREHLINDGILQERTIKLDDLYKYKKIWFINSVRRWLEVQLLQ